MTTSRRLLALVAGTATLAGAAAATTATSASAATDGASERGGAAPKVRVVPTSEQDAVQRLDLERIIRTATPMPMPRNVTSPSGEEAARGRQVTVRPSAPKGGAPAVDAARVTSSAGAVWPGDNTANPNRQIGKLYFDTDPGSGTSWSWCSATAVNTGNKSTVITAGHCVYNPSSGTWYSNLWFYPGYEYGAPLGAFSARTFATTGNYANYGRSADDMAAVVVNTVSGQRLVDRVGGHGVRFNGSVNQYRSAFGYPRTDSRWPGYTADGEDLRYCQGTDTYYSSGSFAGQMLLACRMTGGASGGPWLTSVSSSWMGYVESVNSNKGGIGSAWANRMYGPYFGSQELSVYNWAKDR